MLIRLKKYLMLLSYFLSVSIYAQKATISEGEISFGTYDFTAPNPVPVLIDKPQLYPYHRFDGYTNSKVLKDWKVVTLENDYIKVMIMPQIGGKVWAAIDKSNGADFIYKNDVVKFRNIALRGPWTSGGIEFNFGFIGHTPATATPVDYTYRENEDGSVSCFVGGIDLPSRTQWRVEIRLPQDKAYFETSAQYFNPTNTSKSYYNWMTGAALATDGLEFIYPGNQSLSHGGSVEPWYTNEDGVALNRYENNAFGGHVSRHVVGAYEDFFGGYYHHQNRGFGHLAPYEEMPGQKLWLWALSREGGIWEDLLTDSNGQYMEFQAGRMLNQFSPGSQHNPITKAEFGPHTYDSWSEKWFPFREIGGMVDASEDGVLNVETLASDIVVGVHSFGEGQPEVIVNQLGETIFSSVKNFSPNEFSLDTISFKSDDPFEVIVKGFGLSYSLQPQRYLDRNFESSELAETTVSLLYHEAMELKKNRKPLKALELFHQVVEEDPYHFGSLNAIAEIHLEQGKYDVALDYVKKVLLVDTYQADANFFAGNIYQAMGNDLEALEAYGWAARSMEYRAAAFMEMGGIFIKGADNQQAKNYLKKSLKFNSDNLLARHLLAVAHRKMGNEDMSSQGLQGILNIDPLNHLAYFELSLLSNDENLKFDQKINAELKYQAYLEMALHYYKYGLEEEAQKILKSSPAHPMVNGWLAYLSKSNVDVSKAYLDLLVDASPAFVFPFRIESIDMLQWLVSQTRSWEPKYFLALNYWALNRNSEALSYINDCGDLPDFAPFYVVRSHIKYSTDHQQQVRDLKKAVELDEDDWRNWDYLIAKYLEMNRYELAMKTSKEAVRKFPENYELGLKLVEGYLYNENYQKAIDLLDQIVVLPFEGAKKGRELYEQAFVLQALKKVEVKRYQEALALLDKAREWPESLGVGKPYDPDTRIEDFLTAYCLKKLNHPGVEQYEKEVITYTLGKGMNHLFQGILGLTLLNTFDRQQADSIVGKLSKSSSHQAQWVVATYHVDHKAKDLAKQFQDDLYFKIVSQLIELK